MRTPPSTVPRMIEPTVSPSIQPLALPARRPVPRQPPSTASSPSCCRRAAGRRQRLDRGPHRGLDHPRHAAWRRAGQPEVSAVLLSLDFPHIDTGIDTPAEAAILVIAVLLRCSPRLQPAIPDTGARYPHQQPTPCYWSPISRTASARSVARQARPDLARRHHAVLGRRRHAAVHRAEVGRTAPGLPLSQAAILQGVSAVGIALGAVLAARFIP